MKTRSIAGGLMAAAVLAAPLTAPAAYASGSPSAIADPNGSSLVVSADGVSGYTFRSTSDPFSAFNDQERGVLATMRILGPDGKAMDWFDPSVTGYHDVTSLELGVALGSADVKADGVTVAVGWYDQSGTKVGDHADEATLAKAVVFRATLTGDTSGASVSYTLVKKGATLPDSMRPGDVDGDGKYTANDLKDVQALFDGKPVDGFDPVKGGSYEVSGSGQVTLKNVPQNWKAIEGGDEKTASWTMTDPDGNKVVTYTFTAKSTKPDTKPGDVDGDGKYTAADLKNVKATINGTPINGFNPTQNGTYKVEGSDPVALDGLPDGWTFTPATVDGTRTITVLDPDGDKVVTYTFTAESAKPDPDPDTKPDAKPGDADGDGKYTANDLKNVIVTVGGKRVDGFDPTRDGDYSASGDLKVDGLPNGWSTSSSDTAGGSVVTVTDPDGRRIVVWTFSAGSSSDGDDSSGNGQDGTGSGNGTSPSGSDSAPHDDSSKTGFLAQTGLTSPTGLVGLITVTVGAAAAFIVRLRRRHHED